MDSESSQHRELTLMFTDIVGYSRLMGRDEALTIEMLGDYRKILLAHIEENGGVFIEFAGDAIFSRFDTALSAINAAVAIQKHLQLFNQGRDKELPPLRTRIGLHKGAVLVRKNAVLGDDVNIAARLEPLAVPDGICISKAVYDDIKTELREPIKPLGIQSLKNIEQKIRAYLIKPTGLGWRDHFHYFWLGCAKNINKYRYPISAAFLALVIAGFYFIPRWLVPGYAANYVEIANFQNLMNADGKSDYFSSGITEAVRSQLADMCDVYIVDADKGIHAPIRLEGSMQKIGDNLRIVYRIFRRKGNVQIAGGKLDGAYQDIFILQDRLVGDIARNLASEFKLQNFRPAPLKLTNDITAYDYYLQGMDYLGKPSSQENFDAAIQKFNEALVHDRNFMLANSGLCEAYRLKYEFTSSSVWIEQAESECIKALMEDKDSARSYAVLGDFYRDVGRYTESIKYLNLSLAKDPENISTKLSLARTFDLTQNSYKAETIYIDAIKKAPKNWQTYQGYAYFLTNKGRYQEAIEKYNNVLELTPENAVTFFNLGGAYLYIGDFKRAAKALYKATEIQPVANSFMNTGSMFYFSGDFKSAVDMYNNALRLQPNNLEALINIADTYNLLSGKKVEANEYYSRARTEAAKEIKVNSGGITAYQCLALAQIHYGEIEAAKESMLTANTLDPENTVSRYVNLRIAITEGHAENIRRLARKLLNGGYSEKLILNDPYLAILREKNFQDVFL